MFQIPDPKEQLVAIMKRIYAQGMTTTSGGNLSIKDENGNVYITPGGTDKGSMTAEDIVCIRADGTMEGKHKPSSEYPFHMKIYETKVISGRSCMRIRRRWLRTASSEKYRISRRFRN